MLFLTILGHIICKGLLDAVMDSVTLLIVTILVLMACSCLIWAIVLCSALPGLWCEDLVSLIKLQGVDALQVRLVEEAGHAVLKADE